VSGGAGGRNAVDRLVLDCPGSSRAVNFGMVTIRPGCQDKTVHVASRAARVPIASKPQPRRLVSRRWRVLCPLTPKPTSTPVALLTQSHLIGTPPLRHQALVVRVQAKPDIYPPCCGIARSLPRDCAGARTLVSLLRAEVVVVGRFPNLGRQADSDQQLAWSTCLLSARQRVLVTLHDQGKWRAWRTS
jgi:hypothetical protein